MPHPLMHRLSLRVRLLCIAAFFGASLLPPYVPSAALSMEENEVPQDQFLFVEDGFLMKTSPLSQQGARLAYSESVVHTVQEGDSLEKVATRYNISVQTIQWANSIEKGKPIRPGDELLILPVDGIMHTVKKGQTLSRIAQLYDIPAETIAKQNGIDGGFILAGEQLIVPGGKPIVGGTVIATADNPLQFGKNIPETDVQLKAKTAAVKLAQQAPPEVQAAITAGVLQMPCNNCFYTQYFHGGHYGVDIQTRGGGPIFAAEAGTVIRGDTGWNGGYGNVIEVDHGNGLVTLYAHNRDLYVKDGDTVARGQVIAWMGNTGRVYGATGIHTHFEVHLNGVKKNPLLYLQ